MREILFRGKRVDNGEWVYGYLSKSRLQGYENNTLQPSIDREESGVMITSVVIPETVGQYTGLNDKNGKRIFEGDIVIAKSVIENNTSVYKINFSETDAWFGFESLDGGALFSLNELLEKELGDEIEIEVIGNIHDNPELLEDSK